MPCRDPGYEEYYAAEREERFQQMTRMLCAVMRKVEQKGIAGEFTRIKGLKAWWEEHQEKDRIRIEQERAERKRKKLRKDALAKLSDEEKDALDIY